MKASFVVLAAVSLVSAQNFGAEPSCAVPCLTSAISVAGCALADQGCQCGTGQAAIQTAAQPCLLSACGAVDLGIAVSVGLALCSQYSASIASVNATVTKSSSSAMLTSSSSVAVKTSSGYLNSTTGATTKAATSTGPSVAASSTNKPASVSSAGAAVASLMAGLGGVVALVGGAVALL